MPYSGLHVREYQKLVQNTENSISSTQLTAIVPTFKAVRLQLEVGQVLLMTGDTVHSGDRGIDGKASTRIHWYVMNSNKVDDTYLVDMFGKDFASRFE